MCNQIYDVIIIGGGAAGFSAGIYSARSCLKTLLLEKTNLGGQLLSTDIIDNYPGFPNIQGAVLSENMAKQAEGFGCEIKHENVTDIVKENSVFTVLTGSDTLYKATSIIFAAGCSPKKLGIKGEAEFLGKGVSYCATCDGMFFRKKRVVVIGGGDTGVENAVYLSRLCEQVILIHRNYSLRASPFYQKQIESKTNISILYNQRVMEIKGEKTVQSIVTQNNDVIPCRGVFVSIGTVPNSTLISKLIKTDHHGFVYTSHDVITTVPGLFAAGDVRRKELRQVVTAVSDGALAAKAALEYINNRT